MPELSDEERDRRQRAVDFARASTELSGGKLPPEFDALNQRFVSGELSHDEYLEASLADARSLPAEPPRQEYFTTAAEAVGAARDRSTETLWRVAMSSLFPNGQRVGTIYEGRHADEAAARDAAFFKEAMDHAGSAIATITKVEGIA